MKLVEAVIEKVRSLIRWLKLKRCGPIKVYKVLYRSDWHSLVASGKALTHYSQDHWTRAPRWLAKNGYHLICFLSLRDALQFMNRMEYKRGRTMVIWEAEAHSVTFALPSICNLYHLHDGHFKPNPSSILGASILGAGFWPSGTLMAKEIRLIRKVEEDDWF
jgi:hypothetical protein